MTRQRAVKLLMSHGYSRNQAAELMRARPAGWSNARQYVDVVTAPDVERIADAFRFLADMSRKGYTAAKKSLIFAEA